MSVNIFIEIGYFINQYPFKYLNYKSQTIPSIGAINENDLSLSNVPAGKILTLRYQSNLKLLSPCFFVLAGIVYTSSSDNNNYDLLPSPPSFLMYITVTDGKWYDTDHLSVQIQNVNEHPVFSQTHYSSSRTEGAVCV